MDTFQDHPHLYQDLNPLMRLFKPAHGPISTQAEYRYFLLLWKGSTPLDNFLAKFMAHANRFMLLEQAKLDAI